MQPLARIFIDSATHELAAFKIDGFRVDLTSGLEYRPCDLAVIYGLANPLLARSRAKLRIDVHGRHNGPVLIVESSIIGRAFRPPKGQIFRKIFGLYRKPEQANPSYRLAVGGAFGPTADFNNADRPPDRWERLGIPIKTYRTDGEHIVLIGQTANDASLRGKCIFSWLAETATTLRQNTSRPISIRLHPGMGWQDAERARSAIKDIPGISISPRERSLGKDLEGAWASVSLSSGAAIESMIAGIPAITLSSDSLAYSICSHDLSEIETPAMPAREQWLYDLAYAQWSPDEYADGTAWAHIAPAVWRALDQPSQPRRAARPHSRL